MYDDLKKNVNLRNTGIIFEFYGRTTQNCNLNYARIFIYEMTSHIQKFKLDLMGNLLHVNSITEPVLPMMRE